MMICRHYHNPLSRNIVVLLALSRQRLALFHKKPLVILGLALFYLSLTGSLSLAIVALTHNLFGCQMHCYTVLSLKGLLVSITALPVLLLVTN